MNEYDYANMLSNMGQKSIELFSFGQQDMCKWYFIPTQMQLVIQNSSVSTSFTISYSGKCCNQNYNVCFDSSAPGLMGIIPPGGNAYFSNYLTNEGKIASYDSMMNPVAPNMYLMCSRITVVCQNNVKVAYEFNYCKNENYHAHNLIVIKGSQLNAANSELNE